MNDIYDAMRTTGRMAAQQLRQTAGSMTATEIIASEAAVPDWRPIDYTGWPAGSPASSEGQVWKLLQPYNGTVYTDPPPKLRALWGLCHTTDPARAKPYIAPLGTSGMYMKGDCCTEGGKAWRCKADNTAYSPSEYAQAWEAVI